MDLQDPVSSFVIMTSVVMMLALVFTVIVLAGTLLARDWLGPLALQNARTAGHGVLDDELLGIDPVDHAEPTRLAGADRREHKRLRTRFLGTMHPDTGGLANNLCDIVDLSATGARIRPVDPMPATMPRVAVGLERFGRLPATVVWHKDGEVGLEFDWLPDHALAKLREILQPPTLSALPLR